MHRSTARRHRRHGGRLQDLLSQGSGEGRAARAIEDSEINQLQRNLQDEIRILTDERAKRLGNLLEGKELLADLHDEKTNKKLLSKGTPITRDSSRRSSRVI